MKVLEGNGTISEAEDQYIVTGEWPADEKPSYASGEDVNRFHLPEDLDSREEVTHWMPTALIDDVDKFCERVGVDRSAAINILVARGLEEF